MRSIDHAGRRLQRQQSGTFALACSLLPASAIHANQCTFADNAVSSAPPGVCLKWNGDDLTGACRRCLVGGHWDDLRQSLDSLRESNSRPITLEMSNWEAHQLQTSIVRILLEEILQYSTNVLFREDGTFRVPRVAQGCVDINVEVWGSTTTRKQQFVKYLETEEIVADQLGTLGLEALYVTESEVMPPVHYNYLQDEHWCAAGGMAAFPPDGTTQLSDMLDASGNLVCAGDGPWPNSSCINGRFYPPQCLPLDSNGASPTCRELYLVNPLWSAGWWEALVMNLGLNFTIAYLGSEEAMARRCAERHTWDNIMLYWWTPSVLAALCDLVLFSVPRYTEECVASYHYEPNLSGVNCSPPSDQLMKIINAPLYHADETIRYFFNHYFMLNVDQSLLLEKYVQLGLSVEETACEWLHEHEAMWRNWIPEAKAVATIETVDISILIVATLAVAMTVSFGIITFMFLKRRKLMHQIQMLEDICKTREQLVDTDIMLHKLLAKAEALTDAMEPFCSCCGFGSRRSLHELRRILEQMKTCPPQQLWQVDVAEQLRSLPMDENVKQHLRQQLSLSSDVRYSFKDRTATTSSSLLLHKASPISVRSVGSWAFDIFEVAAEAPGNGLFKELFTSVLDRALDNLEPLSIDAGSLDSMLHAAQAGYTQPYKGKARNYYHCALHAADVFCATFVMMMNVPWESLGLALPEAAYKSGFTGTSGAENPIPLPPITRLASLTAALFHDFRHVGVQTHLLVAMRDPLAITYSDDSVMERMHLAEMFRLFDAHGFLSPLHRAEFRSFRRIVIDMVLATDLGRGFKTVTDVKVAFLASNGNSFGSERDSQADLQSILNLVLECADMSHPSKNLTLHKRWSFLLAKEFQKQGEIEAELGLPMSPLCGPTGDDEFAFARSQKGFIDFVVTPKLATLTTLCSRDGRSPPWSKLLESNCTYWVGEQSFHTADNPQTGFSNSIFEGNAQQSSPPTFEALAMEMEADDFMSTALKFSLHSASSSASLSIHGSSAKQIW